MLAVFALVGMMVMLCAVIGIAIKVLFILFGVGLGIIGVILRFIFGLSPFIILGLLILFFLGCL